MGIIIRKDDIYILYQEFEPEEGASTEAFEVPKNAWVHQGDPPWLYGSMESMGHIIHQRLG